MEKPKRCPNCNGPLVQACEEDWKTCPNCGWDERLSEDLDR